MADTLKVLLVEPGQYPKPVEIENTLQNLQKLVGGHFEVTHPDVTNPEEENVCLVCNEENKFNGSPLNRPLGNYDVIAGNFFICGQGEEDFCSLTPEQMKQYEEKYHDPQWFFRTPFGIVSRSCTPEQYQQYDKICRMHSAPDREER